MEIFRQDDFHECMTTDDCLEVFSTVLKGSSDITASLLNGVISDYCSVPGLLVIDDNVKFDLVDPIDINQCSVIIDCLPEFDPIESHYEDAMHVNSIKEMLLANEWAWCCVKITVKYLNWSSEQFVGCQHFQSGEDFVLNSPLYQGMVNDGLENINKEVAMVFNKLIENARWVNK